jgi:hypothetical protein
MVWIISYGLDFKKKFDIKESLEKFGYFWICLTNKLIKKRMTWKNKSILC